MACEEFVRCRKSWGQWERKAVAKEVQYQEILEEKTALQKAIQVLEHQLLRQGGRINQVLSDWRNNDKNWRRMYKQVVDQRLVGYPKPRRANVHWSHYHPSSEDCPRISKDVEEDASFNQGILSSKELRTMPSGLLGRGKRVVQANHMLLRKEFRRTKLLNTPTFDVSISITVIDIGYIRLLNVHKLCSLK